MERKSCRAALAACLALVFLPGTASASEREGGAALQNLKHIIVVMQENHSFDNYFGALPYVPGGRYHPVDRDGHDRDGHDRDGHDGDFDRGGCHPDDHRCVDGLTCQRMADGTLACLNFNVDADGSKVH